MLAAALLISLGLLVVQATSHNSVSTDVRISARQLDDGRTEFALQQRAGDGWGERILARQRYFPADVGHNRWLNSSPYEVAIGASVAGLPEPPSEYRLEGGEVLYTCEGGVIYGEGGAFDTRSRIPAELWDALHALAMRDLYTEPERAAFLSGCGAIRPPMPSAETPETAAAQAPEENTESTTTAALGEPTEGTIEGTGIFYFHGDAGVNGLRTFLNIRGTTSDSLYEDARLTFFCDHDVQSLWVNVEAGVFIGAEWRAAGLNDHDGITLAAFGTISEQEWSRRGFETYDDSAQVSGSDGTTFFLDALNERWLGVSLPQYSNSITATFDLQQAFGTPIQHLLFGCNRLRK